jgi:hypothetical protein
MESKRRHSWVGHFFGWNAAEVAEDIATKLEEAWTPEERIKLNRAMGYTESTNPASYPKGYIQHQLEFKLKMLNLIATKYEYDMDGVDRGKQLVQVKIENLLNR